MHSKILKWLEKGKTIATLCISLVVSWFLYYMVAHFTMRTYRVNQAFRFDEGTWLHQNTIFYIMRAQSVLSNHLI